MMNFEDIEERVCESVNAVLNDNSEHLASPANLYSGKTRTYINVTIARQFTYYVLHDLYHVAYSVIAKRAGFSVRGVIQNTHKARYYIHSDKVYSQIYQLIEKVV